MYGTDVVSLLLLKRLKKIFRICQTLETKMSLLDDKVTELSASVAAIESAEQAVAAFVAGVPALISAAVEEALAAGAPPATLQAFEDLNTRLQADAAKIVADITTPTPPPATP